MKALFITVAIFSSMLFATADNNQTKSRKVWSNQQLKQSYALDYDKNSTCLVRKIKLYKYPKWVSKIEVSNGKKVYFSSPKSMFEFYHQPGKWFEVGVKNEKDFQQIVVTDYETLKPIDAKKAFYVYGSRATSPAGDDLVAIETQERANSFIKKYGGSRVFTFDKVSDALIRLLNGRI